MQFIGKKVEKPASLKKKRDEKREKTKLKTNNTSFKSKPQILKQDVYFHSFTFCTVECIFAVMNVLLEVGTVYISNGLQTGLHQQYMDWHAWSIHTCFSYSRSKSVRPTLEG